MTSTTVCVGSVVRRKNAILLVRQAKGHSLEGQWTIPWGRLDDGESPTVAAAREVSEEAGIKAEVSAFLGMQELPEPWSGMISLLFLCEHVDGEPEADGHETDAARYFTAAELEAHGEMIEPLSAWLIQRVFEGTFTLLERDDGKPFADSHGYY